MPPNLELLAAAAVAAWQAQGRHWLLVRPQAPLGLALAVPDPQRLRGEIRASFEHLEAGFAAQRRLAGATLGCWPVRHGVRLELWAEGRHVRAWHFPPQPLAGAPPRSRRGRLALPATALWPHARVHAATAACLVSRSPYLLELARSRVSRFGLGAVWQTASLREALQWLRCHPRCWLLLVESDAGVWASDPAGNNIEAEAAFVPFPLTANTLDPLLRRFFHQRVEMPRPRAS